MTNFQKNSFIILAILLLAAINSYFYTSRSHIFKEAVIARAPSVVKAETSPLPYINPG